MKKIVVFILTFVFMISAFAKDYPLKSKYPDVKTIEPSELFALQEKGKAFIIDARGEAGYEIIHIDGAKILHSSKMNKTKLTKSFKQDMNQHAYERGEHTYSVASNTCFQHHVVRSNTR